MARVATASVALAAVTALAVAGVDQRAAVAVVADAIVAFLSAAPSGQPALSALGLASRT
jgi:hypothetical protein